jgi:hypothetical protein
MESRNVVCLSCTVRHVTLLVNSLFNLIQILFYFHKQNFSKERTRISLLLRIAHSKLRFVLTVFFIKANGVRILNTVQDLLSLSSISDFISFHISFVILIERGLSAEF